MLFVKMLLREKKVKIFL